MYNSNSEDARKARELLKKATKILGDVDNAFIIQQRGHTPRLMPKFSHDEIEVGRTLGVGGFGIVSEITAFDLQKETEDHQDHQEQTQKEDSGENKELRLTEQLVDIVSGPTLGDDNDEEVHYDVTKAREVMAKRCLRKGTTRYAIKRLHDNLTELERARGMIDLAIEAKYLSVVWHPNIVKMRGLAVGNLMDEDFFIVMDRLYGTLGQRTRTWVSETKKHKGKLGGLIGKNKEILQELLLERMIIAYDLAIAFWYLHENRLVYRDIKPENIGFDFRGDVKVFDFGLCKSLDPKFKKKDGYGYRMTGRAGSLPYMSPEVAQCQPYDTKCDVYSFAVLLWEILSLKPAFKGFSHKDFIDKVYSNSGKGERPKINNKEWPPLTRLVLPEAWDPDPSSRPDMKRVAIMIRGDLNEMTTDENVRHRTIHMDERSDRSLDNSEHRKS